MPKFPFPSRSRYVIGGSLSSHESRWSRPLMLVLRPAQANFHYWAGHALHSHMGQRSTRGPGRPTPT